jgi:hypothetical protein
MYLSLFCVNQWEEEKNFILSAIGWNRRMSLFVSYVYETRGKILSVRVNSDIFEDEKTK